MCSQMIKKCKVFKNDKKKSKVFTNDEKRIKYSQMIQKG